MSLLYKIANRLRYLSRYSAGKLRAPFASSQFFIKPGYRHRKEYRFFDDKDYKDEFQNEVYELARFYLDKHRYSSVIDIGCGSAFKLMKFFRDVDTTGVDVSPTYEFLTGKYPDRKWVNTDAINKLPLSTDIVICADVIEHVLDPDGLIATLSAINFHWLFLSTPERDMVRGPLDYGPPQNQSHVREWNWRELHKYLGRHFDIHAHMVSNVKDGTQLVICTKKPVAQPANHKR